MIRRGHITHAAAALFGGVVAWALFSWLVPERVRVVGPCVFGYAFDAGGAQ